MTVAEVGEIPGPITAEGPTHVPGEKSLTQSFSGPLEDETYLTRGYDTPSKVGLPGKAHDCGTLQCVFKLQLMACCVEPPCERSFAGEG